MAMLARLRWLVVATVLGSLVGILCSYLLRPQYNARAVIEEFPPRWFDYWGPRDEFASQKLAAYLQQAFTLNNLRPLIERDGITKPDEVEKVYEEIRKNTMLQPASADDAASNGRIMVDLSYTDSTPLRAEQICSVLTSMILEKQRADRQLHSDGAILLLQQFVTEAENHLQDLHKQLSERSSDRKLALEYASAQKSYAVLAAKVEQANRSQPLISGEVPPRGFEGLGMLLPCGTSIIPDFPNRVHCAAIGSAFGLLVGIALIAVRRKSLNRIAEPHC